MLNFVFCFMAKIKALMPTYINSVTEENYGVFSDKSEEENLSAKAFESYFGKIAFLGG